MKRQGLQVTIKQLEKLIVELSGEAKDKDQKFQINIINSEGLSDTWRLE